MSENSITLFFGMLGAIIGLLLVIIVTLGKISDRLKEHMPTAKEEDYDWAMRDPQGHWEAHKDDEKK